jgi:hypothetical protein
MIVGDVSQTVADLTGLMIVHNRYRSNRFHRIRSILRLDLDQTVTDKVADFFRAVGISPGFDKYIEFIEESLANRDSKSDQLMICRGVHILEYNKNNI